MNARQINPQVIRANQARRDVIRTLEGAVRDFVLGKKPGAFALPTAVESELTMVAPRPTSLGFSEHDLSHFASFYAGLAEEKVSAWKWQNGKVLRQDSPNRADVAERDRRYMAVKVARTILSVLTAELGRRQDVSLKEAREMEAQRASIAAQAAEQAAEMAQVTEEVAALSLKIPVKRKSKTVVKRSDFSKAIKSSDAVNPFEALKGELTTRQRSNWKTRAIKKAEALEIAACTAEELDSARAFAQKMGTDEVMELESGVIRARKSGNSVRYEYFGA